MTAYYGQNYPRKSNYLSALPLSSKILITFFYVVMIASIGMSILGFQLKTGLSPSVAAEYVRGNDEGAASTEKMFFAKSKEELADISHPHLFMQGIVLFILGHLLTLSKLRDRAKSSLIAATFTSCLLGIASPWLIRFVSPKFGLVQVGNLVLFSILFLLLASIPLGEMWFGRSASSSS